MQERFGSYRLLSLIGQGGQSTVFRAVNSKGSVVALKVLNKNLLDSPEQRGRFLFEPHQQPVHPNIVAIVDQGGECPADLAGTLSNGQSVPYFATEFIEGRSLQQMMRDPQGHPMRVLASDLYPVLRDIGAALDAIHRQGIIHRDIKPGNILLRAADRRALLSDFGIAKSSLTGNMTMTTTSRPGSATYMAPEQVDPRLGPMSPASDVYSLAATAYEALTGRPPFSAPLDVAVMYKHVNEAPVDIAKIAPDVPRQVAAVVMKALSKQPSQRFASAGEFAARYFEALNTSAARVSEQTSPMRPPLPIPSVVGAPVAVPARPPIGWIPIAGLGAVLVLAVGVIATLGSGRPTDSGPPPVAGFTAVPSPGSPLTVTPSSTGSVPSGQPLLNGDAAEPTVTVSALEPVATSTLAPELDLTARPSPQASGTRDSVGAALRVEATARGGYEEWGRPAAPNGCDDIRNNLGRGFRFKATVRLSNPGPSNATGLRAGFVDTAGRSVVACVEGFGPASLPDVPAGKTRDVSILAYLQTKTIARLVVTSQAGAYADVCYDGETPMVCR